MDNFSEQFVNVIGCGMWHDDREIFHVPEPKENTVSEIKKFLENCRN